MKEKKSKTPKAPPPANPCFGAALEKRPYSADHYAVRYPFAPSSAQLKRYAEFFTHKCVINYSNPNGPSITFDDDALGKMLKRYPQDPLYTLVADYRELEKAKGTYVEGIKPDARGRYGEPFSHRPKTLRLAMKLLQLLPRADDPEPESIYNRIRAMFIAAPGHTILSTDFGGIEAVLVAYFAGDKDLLRLTQIDVHSFLAAHAIGQPADLAWSDADLAAYFGDLKSDKNAHVLWRTAGSEVARPFDVLRTGCKRSLYLSMYLGTPERMYQVEPAIYGSIKGAAWYQDFLFDTFPSIQKWHAATCVEAESKGYITAPDGFRLHYPEGVYDYTWNKSEGKWTQSMGKVAKEAIAARPQHTAFGFSARALIEAFKNPDLKPTLRLSIHDDILTEQPLDKLPENARELKRLMELPDRQMPLPPEWAMGDFLSIKVDQKCGPRWSELKKLSKVA